jgi:hypothetical protein
VDVPCLSFFSKEVLISQKNCPLENTQPTKNTKQQRLVLFHLPKEDQTKYFKIINASAKKAMTLKYHWESALWPFCRLNK